MFSGISPLPVLLTFSFVLGAVIGSFLNVCIYRIPLGLSLVTPGSSCPACQAPIRWYQNVPILSWMFLRGRCAACRSRISMRYPAVETLTGMIFVLVFFSYGMTLETPVYWLLTSVLLAITFIDLDHQIVPNIISLPGIPVGLACATFLLPLTWQDSIFGILLGGGLLWAVATGYRLITGIEGMGMGDVKLLAMIGAFLGWQSILPIVFLGSLTGTMVGIPLMLYRKSGSKLAVPFAPFLSFGAALYLFFWPQIFGWYLTTFFANS